jgi:hypothetical protein
VGAGLDRDGQGFGAGVEGEQFQFGQSRDGTAIIEASPIP